MFPEDSYYIPSQEGDPKSRYEAWRIGFGLQAADGLCPSDYAVGQARNHVEGRASYAEVEHRLREYHASQPDQAEHFEADIVATRISSILQSEAFALTPLMLKQIHRKLFDRVLDPDWVGRLRHVELTKKEPVLNGATVAYTPYEILSEALDHDFAREKERQASYTGMERHAIAHCVFDFVAGIWQIHPFREGNTRTTAVFAILYLRQLGFDVDNTPFATHAQYFRDALALSSTFDPDFKNPEPLERFMDAVLFDPSVRLESLRGAQYGDQRSAEPAQPSLPLPSPSADFGRPVPTDGASLH